MAVPKPGELKNTSKNGLSDLVQVGSYRIKALRAGGWHLFWATKDGWCKRPEWYRTKRDAVAGMEMHQATGKVPVVPVSMATRVKTLEDEVASLRAFISDHEMKLENLLYKKSLTE